MSRRRVDDPQVFGKVAVLMGGWSAEREVSLWSGQAVHAALLARGVDAHAVDAQRDTLFQLKQQGYARAFNVMHGTGGEDGTLQALLDLIGLPYTGSGVLASALAMDKLRTKRMWKAEGLPTPEYFLVQSLEDLQRAAASLGYPLIVKPSEEGSSVGISKVKSAGELADAFALARGESGRVVMAERCRRSGSNRMASSTTTTRSTSPTTRATPVRAGCLRSWKRGRSTCACRHSSCSGLGAGVAWIS
jgi:D-alanine-D-alanine ligase